MSQMRITRRRVLQMIGATAAVPMLVACGQQSTPSPTAAPKTEPSTAPAAAAKPTEAPPAAKPTAAAQQAAPAQGSTGLVTLTALVSVGGSGKALVGGLEKFNEQFAGKYAVKSDMIAIESLLEKEMAQFIAKTPTYDIVSVNSDWLPSVAHFLEPLDKYLEQDKTDFGKAFGPRVKRVVSFDNQVVALPVRFGTDIMFYRQDAFDETGVKVPTTYQEYREAAKKLTVKDASGKVTRFGTSFKAQSPAWTVGSFGHFLFGSGARFITDDGTEVHPSLNSQLSQDLLDNIKATIADGSTPEVAAWTYDDNVVAFQEGRMAMSDEYSARSLLIADPTKSQAAGKMGFSMWMMEQLGPEPPTHAGTTWNFAVDKNVKDKEAAWALLKHMTSAPIQKLMAIEFANGPTLLETYDDPDYVKTDPAAGAIKNVLAGPGWQGYFTVPTLGELQQAAHEEIQSFYLGRQTSKQATENMARRLGQILKS
jgi:multiple sugar transport system substrate-binding protein